jgi:hypothetical protein
MKCDSEHEPPWSVTSPNRHKGYNEAQILHFHFINTANGNFNKELRGYDKALSVFTVKTFTEEGKMTTAQQYLGLAYRQWNKRSVHEANFWGSKKDPNPRRQL